MANNSSEFALPDGPNWTFTPLFTLFIQISAVLMDSSVLYLFVRDTSLLTPFTIYVVNLLVASLSAAIFFYPIEVVNELYPFWWMGHAACTYSNYVNWVFNSAMFHAHALIALNRFWAVTFPVSYRRLHQKQFALGVSIAMWVYLQVVFLPGIIQDALWYRLPEETNGCQINMVALETFSWVAPILMYYLPEVLIIAIYPWVCYKTWKRRRINARSSASRRTGQVLSTAAQVATKSEDANSRAGPRGQEGRESQRVNYGFVSLTLMTLTVLICYTPNQIYYGMLLFFDIDIPNLYQTASVLNALNIVMDPIWLVLALTELRDAFRLTYCCRRA